MLIWHTIELESSSGHMVALSAELQASSKKPEFTPIMSPLCLIPKELTPHCCAQLALATLSSSDI